jgi:hypothetical protein
MGGPNSARQGAIRVHVLQPRVVEAIYMGYLTAQRVEEGSIQFYALLRRAPATHWVIDATALLGFEAKIPMLATAWVEAFKAQGGQLILIVSASSAVRMVATTAGFAAGLPLRVVATHAEAMAFLPAR